MYIKKEPGPLFIKLADGSKLSRSDLPPLDTSRWVARRKARVVMAVVGGLITTKEACNMYELSEDELASWCQAVRRHGTAALRVTALQKYRQL